MSAPHILILGGTGEARRLAERLAVDGRARITLSLAGRTTRPLPQAGTVRTGGFGGAAGLATWLQENAIDLVIDATHPFAVNISSNARAATEATGRRLLVLERPAWQRVAGDRWIDAGSVADAASRLGEVPRTVFLAIGRQELAPFRAAPQHRYIVRSVDPVSADETLPVARFILERGPFDEAAERRLLEENGIDIIVAKNSGGDATYGKIAAARALGVPVVMVQRAGPPAPDALHCVEAMQAAVAHALFPAADRGE